MKHFKQYAFLGLILGLVLLLTPSQSFASRYLAVGSRTDTTNESLSVTDSGQLGSGNFTDNTSQMDSQTVSDDSGQLGSGNIIDDLTGYMDALL